MPAAKRRRLGLSTARCTSPIRSETPTTDFEGCADLRESFSPTPLFPAMPTTPRSIRAYSARRAATRTPVASPGPIAGRIGSLGPVADRIGSLGLVATRTVIASPAITTTIFTSPEVVVQPTTTLEAVTHPTTALKAAVRPTTGLEAVVHPTTTLKAAIQLVATLKQGIDFGIMEEEQELYYNAWI